MVSARDGDQSILRSAARYGRSRPRHCPRRLELGKIVSEGCLDRKARLPAEVTLGGRNIERSELRLRRLAGLDLVTQPRTQRGDGGDHTPERRHIAVA